MRDYLRHFFVPHRSNNHRAKALHVDVLFLYALVFVLFNLVIRTVHTNYPDVLGYATNIQTEELLAATNAQRLASGLQPLVLNQALSQAAAKKAADMFAKNYWAHVGPEGETPWDFIISSGYKYTVAGENLAKNFQDSNSVVTAWMNSPSHRDNLLKPTYREIGFAVVNGTLAGEETTLVVQMFGAQSSASVGESSKTQPVQSEVASIPVVEAVPETKPVEIPITASVTETAPVAGATAPFSSAIITPAVDIVGLRQNVTMVFAGILLGIFIVDMYVAFKRRTVRAVGSTVAHVFFLAAMLVSMNSVLHGAVL
jgi:hypothetical protein